MLNLQIENNLVVLFVMTTIFCSIYYWWYRRLVVADCWFCRSKSFVKRDLLSWWYCIHCQQYNGFDKNGDYNQEISEMYLSPSDSKSYSTSYGSSQFPQQNLLCNTCQIRQNQKIKEISMFDPTCEKYFDKEYKMYLADVEERYKVCLSCRMAVAYHLHRQDEQIRQTHCFNERNCELRQLKSKIRMPGSVQWIFIIGHFISFASSSIILKKQMSSSEISVVLYVVTGILAGMNFLFFYRIQQLKYSSLLSSLLWTFISLYGNYPTNDSKTFRSYVISAVLTAEIVILFRHLLLFIINQRQKWKYLRQRKRKVEVIRNSPKFKLQFNPTSQRFDSNRTMCTPSLLREVEGEVISQRQPDSVTPDLLHGHLNAMYIERNTCSKDKDTKDTNHVIAALKYSTKFTAIHSRVDDISSPKPLLRPAIFVWSNQRQTNNSQEENNNNGGANERNLKNKDHIGDEYESLNSTIGVTNSSTTVTSSSTAVTNSLRSTPNSTTVRHETKQRHFFIITNYCTFTNVVIFGLIASVVFNIYLIKQNEMKT